MIDERKGNGLAEAAYNKAKLAASLSISGIATSGLTNGLTDESKNYETNILQGRTIRIEHDNVEYIREVLANTSTAIAFADLVAPANAYAVIGSGESSEGLIKITAIGTLAGDAGNDVNVVIQHGDTDTGEKHAAYVDGVLTFTIDTNGLGAQQTLYAGDVNSILIADELDDLFSAPTEPAAGEFVDGALPITGVAIDFTGGSDGTAVDAGDRYSLPYLIDPETLNDYTAKTDLASTANGKGASTVGIEDADDNYTADNVEEALGEVAQQISQLADLSTMSFRVTNTDTSAKYKFGLQIKDGKTQIMYEEVV